LIETAKDAVNAGPPAPPGCPLFPPGLPPALPPAVPPLPPAPTIYPLLMIVTVSPDAQPDIVNPAVDVLVLPTTTPLLIINVADVEPLIYPDIFAGLNV